MDVNVTIIALSVCTIKGIFKTNVPEVRLIENYGIEGDAHAGEGHRQVSLLALESIEKIRALGLDVQPGDFAENITVRGLKPETFVVGDRIIIGPSVLEITQIGKECHTPCSIYARVGDCVMPREGLFARVLKGGTIRVGDAVTVPERSTLTDSSTASLNPSHG